MEEIPQMSRVQTPLIIDIEVGETSQETKKGTIVMMIEKVEKPLIASKKYLCGISYYQHSYMKVKWDNIKLLRRNQKLKTEIPHVRQNLNLYECKEGLNTLVKVMEKIG